MQYYKNYVRVLEETKNLIQSNIISLILSKAKGKTECMMQKMWIAEKLYLDRKTVERNIKKLEEMGLITAQTKYIQFHREPKATTHFTITEKLQNLITEEKKNHSQPSKPSNHCRNNGNEKQIEKTQHNQSENAMGALKNCTNKYDYIDLITKLNSKKL